MQPIPPNVEEQAQAQDSWPVIAGSYRVGNPAAPVAVCALTSDELLAPLAGIPGVAIAGEVQTANLGIERIIRNVTANPAIRFLLLCGKESRLFRPGQSLSALIENGVDAARTIIGAEGYFLVGKLVDYPALPIDDAVRPRIGLGRNVSARDYLAALQEREEAKRAFGAALDGIDALLTPTTQTPPIPVDAVDQNSPPAHFTRFVNFLDLCALAVPDGFTETGLPLSLQIVE